MSRKTRIFGLAAVCALATAMACSGSPQTPLSPSAALNPSGALNPDGSSLKITAPTSLSPGDDVRIDTRRPTLSFAPAVGRFVQVPLTYEIEGRDEGGALLASYLVDGTSFEVTEDLPYDTLFQWRVRGRLDNEYGPWSESAFFRTPQRPAGGGGGGGGGGLPFPIPPQCATGGFACVAAVASQSVEWLGCASGSGVHCHRFTRQVAFALASFDPNWTTILAEPGGHACNCNFCGPSDGATMFREDTVVYAGSQVFDMIVSAGGPNPSLQWAGPFGRRPSDFPILAPLCQ